MTQAAEVGELDYLFLLGRQGIQRYAGRFRVDVRDGLGRDVAGVGRVDPFGQRLDRAPPARAQHVDGPVADHRQDPGVGCAAAGVVGVARPPGRQEHFLRDLLSVAEIAQHAVREANRLAVVGVVQHLQVGQLRTGRRGGGHDCTTVAMIGSPVGASTRPRSFVIATVAPRTSPGSSSFASPVLVMPAATGCLPGGMIHAS